MHWIFILAIFLMFVHKEMRQVAFIWLCLTIIPVACIVLVFYMFTYPTFGVSMVLAGSVFALLIIVRRDGETIRRKNRQLREELGYPTLCIGKSKQSPNKM